MQGFRSLLQGHAKALKRKLGFRDLVTSSGCASVLEPHSLAFLSRYVRHDAVWVVEVSPALLPWTLNRMHEPALHDLHLVPVLLRSIRILVLPLSARQLHEQPDLVDRLHPHLNTRAQLYHQQVQVAHQLNNASWHI